MEKLAIVADDYGYAAAYDAGIRAAAAAGAIDAISVMVGREPDTGALVAAAGEAEIGLHLELPAGEFERQAEAFTERLGRPPDYLDGHHHCHAASVRARAAAIAVAQRFRIPVRAVDAEHRAELRGAGIAAADRLVGRLRESEPALAPAIARMLDGSDRRDGRVTEWMTHPGFAGGASGSSFHRGREEDLALLLELGDRSRWRRRGIRRCGPRRASR